ncbi:aldo/keto reductase [Spirochaetia bacterium 38H-sp]|uniref:Aldo/keto reductase n=1 Tax=Rarispira pelagica TaxID=3141764 RepID=A0ABU9UA17_9SPIR
MEKKRLGNSDMDITRIGLGAWAIGGSWRWGWGHQDEKDSIRTIHKALDSGINWIDTAPAYGLGTSEKVIGKALKERNDKPYIFTKCGILWDNKGKAWQEISRKTILKEIDESLTRLGVDVIDLYQIHWPNPDKNIEEAWETLAEIKEQGKVRYIGVSNFSVEQLKRAEKIAPITSLQPPYSILRRDIEKEILPHCQEKNIGVIVYSPMASGLLTGKVTEEWVASLPDDDWRKQADDFRQPRLARNLALVEILRDIAKKHNSTIAETAIAWTLKHPAVTAAIVGMRRPDQVDGVTGAPGVQLDNEDLERIETFIKQNP